MAQPHSNKPALLGQEPGSSPFDAIRRTDAYGREYWLSRELQPLMGYSRWENLAPALARAMASARNQGMDVEGVFLRSQENPSAQGGRPREDYHLTRTAAYLLAMNGDPNKAEVAAAQAYFTVKTREAELGAITTIEVRQTALARAREMVDYQIFRDMMADNATDYEPSSKATRNFFAAMQNKLYRHLTGMDAQEIKQARQLNTWPGREDGKPEPSTKSSCRKVAKNYLTDKELHKLNRLVGRLCLRAEDIADDDEHLTLTQWRNLVEVELAVGLRQIAA